ncbi:MAG: hypothetical protein JWR75_1728 [Devosia sp.]|nr:hypothetical protein [Devosia sp.]
MQKTEAIMRAEPVGFTVANRSSLARTGRYFGQLAHWAWIILQCGFLPLRFNPPGKALRFMACNIFAIRRVLTLNLFGYEVALRTGTPDLMVAIDSLGHEFDSVIKAFPRAEAGVIIDAGGYIGTAAIKFASNYPKCQVICIEPSPANLELLKRNISGYPNITLVQAALAASDAGAMLSDAGRSTWGHTITTEIRDKDRAKSLGSVETTTIDQIMRDAGAERLFLMKLDIEGAEIEVLDASATWIDHCDVLVTELHERMRYGTEASFDRATRGRFNSMLPGEKILSLSRAFKAEAAR